MSDLDPRYAGTAARYPTSLPCASRDGYGFAVTTGAVKTRMQGGWTRKRRMDPTMFRTFQLSFRMPTDTFDDWHQFVHKNAFNWIRMNVQSNIPSGIRDVNQNVSEEVIRFISDVSWSYTSFGIITANVQAEGFIDPVVIP